MAHLPVGPTFQSLTPEIRNEIYGYLFGEKRRLKLIDKGYRYRAINQADQSKELGSTSTFKPAFGYIVGRRRHSAILRTCRQIYHESVPVLYGSTVFSFFKIKALIYTNWSDVPHSFPAQCLQHVQKLEISVEHDEPQYTSWRAERIAFLIREASVMRQLCLSFYICALWAMGDKIDIWTQDIVYKCGIPEMIKASRSLRKVYIKVTNIRDLDVARYFAPFVHAITTMKDWSCEHNHEPLVKAEEGVDGDGIIWKQGQRGHKWTWNLLPVPSEATKRFL